jgi:hypothetical protein
MSIYDELVAFWIIIGMVSSFTVIWGWYLSGQKHIEQREHYHECD